METVFISYAKADKVFAALVAAELKSKFDIWKYHGRLGGGDEWRKAIDEGIGKSFALLVLLSPESCASPYVTYEWAYAIGNGKTVIPLKYKECQLHPRLEVIQYIDFSADHLPWEDLRRTLGEFAAGKKPRRQSRSTSVAGRDREEELVRGILSYMKEHDFRLLSFERVRKMYKITNDELDSLLENNPGTFRRATLVGGKPGLKKVRS